jgi:hypothetical protein
VTFMFPAAAGVLMGFHWCRPGRSPDGASWASYLVTHRGWMTNQNVDGLWAYSTATHNLYLFKNNGSATGLNFDSTGGVVSISKADVLNDEQFDRTTGKGSSTSSCYVTSTGSCARVRQRRLGTAIQLGSSGWNAFTLLAPGTLGGQTVLWARDNATGAIYQYPITFDAAGYPVDLGAPTSGSGTVISGVTVTSAAYPTVTSSGPLSGGTCGTADPTACPGIYATDILRHLWCYQGQSKAGGAASLSGTRTLSTPGRPSPASASPAGPPAPRSPSPATASATPRRPAHPSPVPAATPATTTEPADYAATSPIPAEPARRPSPPPAAIMISSPIPGDQFAAGRLARAGRPDRLPEGQRGRERRGAGGALVPFAAHYGIPAGLLPGRGPGAEGIVGTWWAGSDRSGRRVDFQRASGNVRSPQQHARWWHLGRNAAYPQRSPQPGPILAAPCRQTDRTTA